MNKLQTLLVACLVSASAPLTAFDGHRVSEGPWTLVIEDMDVVKDPLQPQVVPVRVRNDARESGQITLELRELVDPWTCVGNHRQSLIVPAGKEVRAEFRVLPGRGCYSAHYPIHIYGTVETRDDPLVLHAVRIVETEISPQEATGAKLFQTAIVPRRGGLDLTAKPIHRIRWQYYDGPLHTLPAGWEGNESECRASVRRMPITRGTTKFALAMHPPFVPGGGTIFAEYRVRLPDVSPLQLLFSYAIRDHSATEPPSDGVTFRVWVDDEVVFEEHSDAKQWQDGVVDLSPFRGKEVLLRLESHPGPRRDTTCDQSYWGNPVIVAGDIPQPLTIQQREALREKALAALDANKEAPPDVFRWHLGKDLYGTVSLGPRGLIDGAIALGSSDKAVCFSGMEATVDGNEVGVWPSALAFERLESRQQEDGLVEVTSHWWLDDKPVQMTTRVWADAPALRIAVTCSRPLNDLAFGPADRPAERVYYGHGYCIVKPEAFRASAGGHNLATSHVGFDFDGGLSLLMACDVPPEYFEVDPNQRCYTLHAHPDTTFTLVPGDQGALDAAVQYRPRYDKSAAPAVGVKAGRFCYDIWGGRYDQDAALLRRAFAYGVTDAMVMFHVWQRWGYDYRLPDIYPPNPDLGSLSDMQELAKTCADHGVLFGLHDNYIDFYPDATGFNYDHIVFDQADRPMKAWINTGRDAQSYRWRPDHIQPFVERNLNLIAPNIPLSAYFIDVFTSINSFDYYDREGHLHGRLETRRAWADAFNWIRRTLGGDAPMVSEAGGDHLIGHVDGADCQFLQLTDQPQRFRITLKCEDWERVPWFDAVNHTRFSLHGVGYSGRYQGGRSRELHGIESDDYLSAEILTGHALMIDRPGLIRGAVRKYWLAQDWIRSVALDEMASVEFADDDIHRSTVRWQSGAVAHVNRSDQDWEVAGHRLPPFGFFAQNGVITSAVHRMGDQIVEQSQWDGGFYVNGRGFVPDQPLPIRVKADRVEYLGDRRFRLICQWDAQHPAPKDLAVFMHFFQPQVSRLKLVGFYGGGGFPDPPTSRWQGKIMTGKTWTMTLPDDCPPGRYDILVGLYDPERRGQRYRLLGREDPERRYHIGTLVVEGRGSQVTGIRLERNDELDPLWRRLLANQEPTDFGLAVTRGAFRCQVEPDHLVITPLPNEPPVSVTLRLDKITGSACTVATLVALDERGQSLGPVAFHQQGNELQFETRQGPFAYQINLARPDRDRQ